MKRLFKVFSLMLLVAVFATFAVSCSKTNDKDNNNDNLSKHTHTYGEWKTVTNPTCTAGGERKRTFSCGQEEREPIAAFGHDMQNGTCTRCNVEETALEYSYDSDAQTYSVTGCSREGSIAIIPDTYNWYPVTGIGPEAFGGCTKLTSITIGNNVTSIGDSAFVHCTGLTSITVPKSVTSIGGRAFFGCEGLMNISIPDSVTVIGDYAFIDCPSLAIYCEDRYEQSGWSRNWNPLNRPVVWGATKPE